MSSTSYSHAIELANHLYLEIDHRFHHGSCDGTMFIGPADKNIFQAFWNKYHNELHHFSTIENKQQLLDTPTSSFNVYFYYIDDNTWASMLYEYDVFKSDWKLISWWGGDF